MKPVLSSGQIKALESAAAASGMPEGLLMENAGSGLAEHALSLASPSGRFAVLCGRGNNGGDGLVTARKLAERGRSVLVEVVGGEQTLAAEPARNLAALSSTSVVPGAISAGAPLCAGDVIVDALLGTGLNRPPEGAYADAIRRILAWRALGAKVISADLPSGLSADSGRAFVPCVRADVTACFGFLKVGLALEPGASLAGEIRLVPIGLPSPDRVGLAGPKLDLLEVADARSRIPVRSAEGHKGTYGHVLVVAGSAGKTGAAALCAVGALRAGAGLVTVAARSEVLPAILGHAPELMALQLAEHGALGLPDLEPLVAAAEGKQSLVIGPGIARGEKTAELLAELLARVRLPCVLDADALNALAGNVAFLGRATAPVLLTPHPGEMGRLLGTGASEVQKDRLSAVRRLATERGVLVVLKGARTLIARPSGDVWINPTGNPGMATGGTGDVLAGICGGLLAQGLSAEDAALCGVYAHGLAGDKAVERTGQMGLIASDLLSGLGEVWAEWGR